MNRKSFLRILSLIGIMAILFSAVSCQKESYPNIPDPTDAFYVMDDANVLSGETESHILSQNHALSAMTGAQVVVVTVRTTGTQDIADFVKQMFNKWKIGDSEKDNGVLILLSIEEDDYYIMQGKGLEDLLSSGTIKNLMNQYLEPDFAAKEYDRGVLSIFDAIIAQMESIYQVSLATWDSSSGDASGGTPSAPAESPAHTPDENESGIAGVILWLLILLVLIVFIIAWIRSSFHGPRGGGGGGGFRRHTMYYSPPPRHFGGYHRPPTGAPPHPGSFGPRPGSTSRPGSYGPRPGSTSRPGSYGPRPGSTSRPGGSFGSRPGGSSGRSHGGGGMTRGGGAGRR